MRAAFLYGAGDVRVETAPAPVIQLPTDAIVRTVRSCICGSDLHPFRSAPASEAGRPVGHELIAVVEEVGSAVLTVKPGDFVVVPFAFQDNTCVFCREGMQTSCLHGGWYGTPETGGLQADLARIPQADGCLVVVPDVDPDQADEGLLASPLEEASAYEQAFGIVRPGGIISRVGVPQYEAAPIGFGSLFGKNARLAGGPAPVRAYLEAAIPQVLSGQINPGKVFDRTVVLEEVPAGYAEMDARTALKVMVRVS